MAAETNAHEKCPSFTHISTHSATSAKTTRYTPQCAVQDTGASLRIGPAWLLKLALGQVRGPVRPIALHPVRRRAHAAAGVVHEDDEAACRQTGNAAVTRCCGATRGGAVRHAGNAVRLVPSPDHHDHRHRHGHVVQLIGGARHRLVR